MKSLLYIATIYASTVYLLGWTRFGDWVQEGVTETACWVDEDLRGWIRG